MAISKIFRPFSKKNKLAERHYSVLPAQLTDGHPWHVLNADEVISLQNAKYIWPYLNTAKNTSGIEVKASDAEKADIPVPSRIWQSGTNKNSFPYIGLDMVWVGTKFVPNDIWTSLSLLMEGDAVRMLWWPDAETTGPLADAHFHADTITLEVKRDQAVFIIKLASKVSPEGSTIRIIRQFDPTVEPNLINSRTN